MSVYLLAVIFENIPVVTYLVSAKLCEFTSIINGILCEANAVTFFLPSFWWVWNKLAVPGIWGGEWGMWGLGTWDPNRAWCMQLAPFFLYYLSGSRYAPLPQEPTSC